VPRKAAEVSYAVGVGTVTVPIRVTAYGQSQTFHATIPLEDAVGKSEAEIQQLAFDQQEQQIETNLVQWDFAQRRGDPPNTNGLPNTGGGAWKKFTPPAS
jgi:hypothetical protein